MLLYQLDLTEKKTKLFGPVTYRLHDIADRSLKVEEVFCPFVISKAIKDYESLIPPDEND